MLRKSAHQYDLPEFFENSEIERALNQVMLKHDNLGNTASHFSEVRKQLLQSHSSSDFFEMDQK